MADRKTRKTPFKITCIGGGYVGGPTMAVMSQRCANVCITVVDINKTRIDEWNSDELPIYEPGLDEIVKKTRGKTLFFSTEVEKHVAEADMIFISVNTPTKTSGVGAGYACNVEYLEKSARLIAKVCKTSKIIVEKSTVPVRAAESISKVIHANEKDLHFDILNNPEFLAEGTAIRDLQNPDRVLIGSEQTESGLNAMKVLFGLYADWVPEERIITTNLWSSELSKLTANAFLAQRVSSINAMSLICEASGADVDEVARAIGSDSRIGSKFLKSSVGFGGSCFRKDINNLIWLAMQLGLKEVSEYWRQVILMNDYQKRRFSNLVVKTMFNTISNKKLAILGFAFKKDTGDTRDSPAIDICQDLLEEGAIIHVYDPKVREADMLRDIKSRAIVVDNNLVKNFVHCKSLEEAVDGAHGIVCLTEWDEFKGIDLKKVQEKMIKPAFVFDGRDVLPHMKMKEMGFEVFAIGKPNRK